MNVNSAEAYFVCHKAPMPQLEFRKLIAKDLIHNEYLMEEQNQQELCISQRKQNLSTHCLQSLPPFRKFVGTKIQKSKSKYPQATCTSGHRKLRTYCICTPGKLRCDLNASHCIVSRLIQWLLCRTEFSPSAMVNQGISEELYISINST